MAESEQRRRKRAENAAYARTLTPAERLQRAAAMTNASRKLRAAGLARLGLASVVRDAPPRKREK